VDKFRKSFQADEKLRAGYRSNQLHFYNLDGFLSYFLGTGDAELGKHLLDTVVPWVQDNVNMYLNQEDHVAHGFAPHHQTRVLIALNVLDVALASEQVTPEMRERLLAQITFIGYTVNSDDYWSPESGFAANPNTTTTVAAYQSAIGCFLPTHPKAKEWVARGMKELKEVQLDTWSDANGGWLEAPHYAMVSFDSMLGCFLMAHNAGFNDYLFDPKMKKVIEWMAKISTPPDARINGIRHRPAIGNSYMFEPSSEFAHVAYLWKDKDPEFASNMQWMWRQQGSYPQPGIGGFFATLAGYRTMLLDPDIPEKAPAYGSELFPETGVMLRTGFRGDRETQLHLIVGNNHAHYDNDSGSVTIGGRDESSPTTLATTVTRHRTTTTCRRRPSVATV